MTVNYGAKYGEWIAIDNEPEIEDTYLVAWLPEGMKRSECFVALMEYYQSLGWDTDDLEEQQDRYWGQRPDIELYAWMPLPDMYKVV